MARSFRELATLIKSLGPLIKNIGADVGGGLGAINDLIAISTKSAPDAARQILEAGRITPQRGALAELFEPIGGTEFVNRAQAQARNAARATGRDFVEVYVETLQRGLKTLDVKAATLPANFMDMVDQAPGRFKPKTKPSAEEERRLKLINKQNIAAERRLFVSQSELAIAQESSDLARIDLEFDLRKGEVQREYNKLISEALSGEAKTNLEKAKKAALDTLSIERNKAISGHMQDQFDSLSAATIEMQELLPLTGKLNSQYEELNTTFRTGVVDGILAAVEGTQSLSDSLVGVIKQMARLILQQQLLNALKGFNLFGGGGDFAPEIKTRDIKFFADGGRPPVGRPSVVGERGPELFVPDRAGTIIPNGGFGGANVVVNVDASGSNVQGDEGSSRQLGALIGAAVQGEIIKQQRPGGLLSR